MATAVVLQIVVVVVVAAAAAAAVVAAHLAKRSVRENCGKVGCTALSRETPSAPEMHAGSLNRKSWTEHL